MTTHQPPGKPPGDVSHTAQPPGDVSHGLHPLDPEDHAPQPHGDRVLTARPQAWPPDTAALPGTCSPPATGASTPPGPLPTWPEPLPAPPWPPSTDTAASPGTIQLTMQPPEEPPNPADLSLTSHLDVGGDLAEQPPGATSCAACHPDDTGQPPAWPGDISHHQPALPGLANHAPRPPEDDILDARHLDDLHHHPQSLGDLAQDSSSLCLWPYEPSTVDFPKPLPGQHVRGALLELQHLLAQADHYAIAGPDLPRHDAHPPPLPGDQPRPPPHPGEGKRLLICLWSVPGLNDRPETMMPTSPLVPGVAARWLPPSADAPWQLQSAVIGCTSDPKAMILSRLNPILRPPSASRWISSKKLLCSLVNFNQSTL